MRSLLVLIDGLGDSPIPAWQGQTPFEHAVHPAMDALAASGTLGSLSICEKDIIPESCSCILRLLGVDKKDIPHNRAYLELLAHNRDISEYEMVLRCNLAAVDVSGRLAAFNGQGLTPLEMHQAAKQCDGILKDIEFIHLSEYRNLLVMNREASVLDCTVQPPHESVGEDVNGLLQELRSQSLSINYFLQESAKRLQPFARDGLQKSLHGGKTVLRLHRHPLSLGPFSPSGTTFLQWSARTARWGGVQGGDCLRHCQSLGHGCNNTAECNRRCGH